MAAPGAVVVPVPLHWRRFLARRYNQSEELAYGLARRLGLETGNVLRRVTHTPILARRGRVERAKLLRGVFQVRARRSGLVRGRTVLLVDDVLTTGATSGAAARALKRAGAARVVAVVVGRAEGRP
jgi:predicted amidophosphoribosyltransferase